MWKQLDMPWRIAFEEAWKSYKRGSFPVGAALMDSYGTFMASGRNCIKDLEKNSIHCHPLAHAVINTLLKVQTQKHSKLDEYQLYTTLEPCPLCFGALILSNVKHLHYAAKDDYAGSSDLTNEYILNHKLEIDGPFDSLSDLQIALITVYLLENNEGNTEKYFKKWEKTNKCGIVAGKKWYQHNRLKNYKEQDVPFAEVYEILLNDLCEIK